MRLFSLATLLIFLAPPAVAESGHGGNSPYAGEELRAIKSLSTADLEELRRGGGWGLAKPAELNGVPGPAHLLELRDEIPLEPGQVDALQALFEEMRAAAIEEDERYIAAEEELEQAFRAGGLDETRLDGLLSEIGNRRAALRYVHLSAHLEAAELLTRHQIARYNLLRGYADPASDGHQGHRH